MSQQIVDIILTLLEVAELIDREPLHLGSLGMEEWDVVESCYDNAVIESFWGRLQVELLN